MDFRHASNVEALREKLRAFMDTHIYPNVSVYEEQLEENKRNGRMYGTIPLVEELKPKAREQGLWNLFLPPEYGEYSPGLTNLEYAPLAEIMGRVTWASEVFNCAAPDTGNMEVLARYGSEEQKRQWLHPLLDGEIRSSFAMTEPAVASSDATNIETRIQRDGDAYVINGRKWFITGGCNERTKLFIVMGKTDPDNPNRHQQQSMIIVPKDAPGVTVVRDMPVYGYYHAPKGHPEVLFDNVRVPAKNLILGEGRGFEIAQGRLGPGRIHHCMRSIGQAERMLEAMIDRALQRVAFGKPVADQGVTRERIAEARIMIDQCRLLTLHAAHKMDTVGNKEARSEIAMIKIAVPNMLCKVSDWAIQVFGGGGTGNDFGTAMAYAMGRVLRLADGPDEVHRDQLARMEIRKRKGPNHPGWEPMITARALPQQASE